MQHGTGVGSKLELTPESTSNEISIVNVLGHFPIGNDFGWSHVRLYRFPRSASFKRCMAHIIRVSSESASALSTPHIALPFSDNRRLLNSAKVLLILSGASVVSYILTITWLGTLLSLPVSSGVPKPNTFIVRRGRIRGITIYHGLH